MTRTPAASAAGGPDGQRADLRLLVPALVGWAVAAAGLAWEVPMRWGVVAVCAVGGAAGLWVLHRSPATRATGAVAARSRRAVDGGRPAASALVFSALVVALLLGASTVAQTQRQQGLVRQAVASEGVVQAEVTLTADARRVFTEGRFGRREMVLVRARAHRMVHRGQESRVDAPLLVLAAPDRGWEGLTWRTRLVVSGRLGHSDPGDDVVAVLTPSRQPDDVVPPGGGWKVAEGLRQGLRDAMDPVWADGRGLVPGLVLGDTSLTPPELTEAMTETGMTHLSAVSGSNVAIVVGAVLWVSAGVGLPRRARPWAAAAALVGFVVLARPEPSVLRAGVMGAVALAGMSASRRAASLPALATSMVLLLVWDPWLARSYGFALSVLATLGLVLFVRPWAQALRRRWPRCPEPVAQALMIPVAASVTTAPVVAMLQGQVSVVGLLTNLLAAPLVAPSTLGGVLVVLVHPVSPELAGLLAWCAGAPAQVIGWTARGGAAVPNGAVPWPATGPAGLVLALVLAVVVLCGPALCRGVGQLWAAAARRRGCAAPSGLRGCGGAGPAGHRWRAGSVGAGWTEVGLLSLAAAVAVATWGLPGVTAPASAPWRAPGDRPAWQLVMCDVGQGDAVLVRTGPQRAVLVDTGPPGSRVAGCLQAAGVRALDAVVITHSHADHSGNLGAVLDAVPVGAVWASPSDLARPMQPGHPAEWREVAHARGATVTPWRQGQEVVWGDARLVSVWPRPQAQVAADDRRNDASLVLHATVPGPDRPTTALLTGDLEVAGGAAVAELTASMPVDVLKVPHHGSAHQGQGLLRRGFPLALVSAGRQNDHGHPAPRTVEALQQAGSTVVGTPDHGDLAVGGSAADSSLWWAGL